MIAASPALAQDFALPDPTMTPGAVDHRVTMARVKGERTRKRRAALTDRCNAVFRAYSIPDTPLDRYSYECDHRVPLAVGGSNAAENLWPQPNVEAAVKDACEVAVQRAVISGEITLDQGQAVFLADNWVAACRPYIGQP